MIVSAVLDEASKHRGQWTPLDTEVSLIAQNLNYSVRASWHVIAVVVGGHPSPPVQVGFSEFDAPCWSVCMQHPSVSRGA
jgi:hypothetical protein